MVHYLSNRNNWQKNAITESTKPEKSILKALQDYSQSLYGTKYLITHGRYRKDHEELRKQAKLTPYDVWSNCYKNGANRQSNSILNGRLNGCQPDIICSSQETGRSHNTEIKNGNTEGNAHVDRATTAYTVKMVTNRKRDHYLNGTDNYLSIFCGLLVTASINPIDYTTDSGKYISANVAQVNSLKLIEKIDTFIPEDQYYLWMNDIAGCNFLINYFETVIRPIIDYGGPISTMDWVHATNNIFE